MKYFLKKIAILEKKRGEDKNQLIEDNKQTERKIEPQESVKEYTIVHEPKKEGRINIDYLKAIIKKITL